MEVHDYIGWKLFTTMNFCTYVGCQKHARYLIKDTVSDISMFQQKISVQFTLCDEHYQRYLKEPERNSKEE